MSSMGDVFHTFPALSDALQAWPDLQVDWVVEEAFAEIPQWHPAVNQVFPIALRRWRKTFWQTATRQEIRMFFQTINQTRYDVVLDAQGLLKSLWVLRKIGSGERVGMDWQSVREPLASLGYQRKISVPKAQHAIVRLRQLFSAALGYEDVSASPVQYRLDTSNWQGSDRLPADF
jgi:heptosyltransferase-1